VCHRPNPNTGILQALVKPIPEFVIADLGDHGHGMTEFRYCDGLVRPFPPIEGLEGCSRDGLSGRRNPWGTANKVEIDASHNYNVFTSHSCLHIAARFE